jgi:hypothetical protein
MGERIGIAILMLNWRQNSSMLNLSSASHSLISLEKFDAGNRLENLAVDRILMFLIILR